MNLILEILITIIVGVIVGLLFCWTLKTIIVYCCTPYDWCIIQDYTKEQKQIINDFKFFFRCYFEGDDNVLIQGYDSYIPIRNFGITDLEFIFDKENKLQVTITLIHPGILIGKHGHTLDSLTKFLKERIDIKILLKESKLWHKIE